MNNDLLSIISGITSWLIILAINHLADQLTQTNLPVELQLKLPQLFDDVLAPLQIYGIVALSAGVVLVILSFVIKTTAE